MQPDIKIQIFTNIYKFIEFNQNLGQKVRFRFGFVTLMGSVRFEFYIIYVFSTWVQVRFDSHLYCPVLVKT